MEFPITEPWFLFGVFLIIVLVIIFLIIWQVNKSRTSTVRMETDLEKEKLALIKEDIAKSVHPFTKLSPEQLSSLTALEEENEALEVNIYAKSQTVEGRIRRLENHVKMAKLDQMLAKIDKEESKVK